MPPVPASRCSKLLRVFPLVVPFIGLSFTYALYFCMMQLYDRKCDANAWGYNSVDQVGLPVYMYPTLLIASLYEGWRTKGRHAAEPTSPTQVAGGEPLDEEQEEKEDANFWQAIKHSVRENAAGYGQGFAFMFLYRLLINGRAVAYFWIASEYDLSEAYFVLTLVRVLLSWVVSLALVLVVPRYIHSDAGERAQLLDRANLIAKTVGSVCVVLSLLFINHTI